MGLDVYLAVLASFSDSSSEGYGTRLLAFSPMCDEDSIDAEVHLQFILFILEVFNKGLRNVCCIIGYNCKNSCALANRFSLPLIGCTRHRFNLSANDIW